jgi:hypothetical protein
MDKVQKQNIMSVNFSLVLSSLLSTQVDVVMQALFGSTWSGLERFSLVLCGLAFHMQI